MSRLRWTRHEDLAIERRCSVRREEYLDHMTFQANERALFNELFGPLTARELTTLRGFLQRLGDAGPDTE